MYLHFHWYGPHDCSKAAATGPWSGSEPELNSSAYWKWSCVAACYFLFYWRHFAIAKMGRLWSCKSAGVGVEGAMVTAVIPNPACGQWSYLECGHGWVPAIPVYGVELGRVVELMVQLRMSFASVHHFLEGKRGRDSNKNEPNRKIKKKQK